MSDIHFLYFPHLPLLLRYPCLCTHLGTPLYNLRDTGSPALPHGILKSRATVLSPLQQWNQGNRNIHEECEAQISTGPVTNILYSHRYLSCPLCHLYPTPPPPHPPKKDLLNDSWLLAISVSAFSWAYADLSSKLSRCSTLIFNNYIKAHRVGPGSPREASCLVQKLGSQVNLILQGEPGSVLQFVSSNRCIWNTIWQQHQTSFLWASCTWMTTPSPSLSGQAEEFKAMAL